MSIVSSQQKQVCAIFGVIGLKLSENEEIHNFSVYFETIPPKVVQTWF